jgi:hypothetical protein
MKGITDSCKEVLEAKGEKSLRMRHIWSACALLDLFFCTYVLVFPFFHLVRSILAGILGGKMSGSQLYN